MTAAGLQPDFSTRDAETMVVSAMTEPTERSIPPEMMTNVMPMAVMARNALSMKKLRKTCSEKNPSNRSEPAPYMNRNRPRVTAMGSCFAFRRNPCRAGAAPWLMPTPPVGR